MAGVEECRAKCHTPCNSVRYEMRSSTALLDRGIKEKLRKRGINVSTPLNELIRLDVSFGRMEYAELNQTISKTFAQMVADIGGTMNFWLGASLIALIELAIMLTGTCTYIVCFRGGTGMCCR